MKSMGKYVRENYAGVSAKWVFGVIVALGLLPDLIKTVLLSIKKESLGSTEVFLAEVFCLICVCGLTLLAIRSITGQTDRAAVIWCKGGLPCVAVLYGGKFLTALLGACFGTTGKIVGCAAAGILLGISFYLLSSAMSDGFNGKAGRKIVKIATYAGLAIVFWYLLPYFLGLGVQAVFAGSRVWCVKLVAELLNAVIRWILIMPVLKFVCSKDAEPEAVGEKASEKAKKPLLLSIPAVASAAVLLTVAVLLFPKEVSPAERLKEEYYSRTNTACYNLLGGNIITAVNAYGDIQRELEVWKSVADGGWNDISESEIASNQMLAYLDTYTNHTDDRLETMERYYTVIYGIDYNTAALLQTDIENAIKGYSKSYPAKTDLSLLGAESVGVSWEWPFETGENADAKAANNVKDTYLGKQAADGNAATVSIEIAATVTQID